VWLLWLERHILSGLSILTLEQVAFVPPSPNKSSSAELPTFNFMMNLLNKITFRFLGFLSLLLTQAAAQQWQVTSLQALDISTSNGTVSFTVAGASSSSTSCTVNWTQSPSPVIPTSWTKCQSDPMLRFRFVYFQFAGNFSLEIVEITTLTT